MLIAFVMFEAAYYSEIIRAGISSVRRGQISAAMALGLTRLQSMRYVVLPQAIRNMMPVLLTQSIVMLQDTSLVYVVGLRDFLTTAEVDGARPVCVLGWDLARNFFPHGSGLGRKVRIGAMNFEVVGILEKRGKFLGLENLDNTVYVPVTRFANGFYFRPGIRIAVKVGGLSKLEDAKEEVRGVMRKVRRLDPGAPDDFAVNSQDAFVAKFNRMGAVVASVGLFITGMSLFVGGIGIMNIMFVSVAERTKEIGIRKAIGAKRRTILIQFLIEAASICLLGGLIGLAIAWPITMVITHFLPTSMSPLIVGVALLVSILTGVIAGFLPAWRAARMNPVDALRNE